MEYIDNRLCVTYTDLNGIVSPNNIKQLVVRKRVEKATRGGNGHEAQVYFDSLPLAIRNEFYRRNPDLEQTSKAQPFADTVVIDGAAYDFFSGYRYGDGKKLPQATIDEYTMNASILNRFTEILDEAKSMRNRVGNTKRIGMMEFWQDKAAILPLIQDKLGHSLPCFYRKLQAKYLQYKQHGYAALISRHYANVRASKIKTQEQEDVIIRLIGDGRNLDNKQIADFYNFICSRMEDKTLWQPITARNVAYLRQKHDLITAAARHGTSEFYNNKAMQVKRAAPSAPMLYWTADGWDVELFYQKTSENTKGHYVTSYNGRATIVVILDAYNKYPVGYAIGDHECPELIKDALQNAVNHTRELFGTRYRTAQYQCDNYAIKKMRSLYAMVADKVTPTNKKTHNAKAKIIEPYFNHLNKTYCQWCENWSGFGITSRKDRQPNWEQSNALRHNFPDYNGVVQQITAIMEQERKIKRSEYVKGFTELTPEEYRLPFSTENYLLAFGYDTGRLNAIEGQGLRPTIEGIKRDFDCFDPNFRRYGHIKWAVKYDPQDLTQALAVSEDGTLQFMLENKYIQPMALADRKEGDAKQLERIFTYNKNLEKDIIDRMAIACETTERLVLEHPNLKNTLAKSVIVNSLGQHKDARNEIRQQLETGDDDVKITVPKPKKIRSVILTPEKVEVVAGTKKEADNSWLNLI